MAGLNGTANGTVAVGERKFRRPRRYVRAVTGGRVATTSGKPYSLAVGTIMPPPEATMSWQYVSHDLSSVRNGTRLLEYLVSMSPEVSKGVWDYLRLLNPGWEVEVFNPGSDTPNARGQRIVEDTIARLHQKHGSFDVVLSRLHIGAYSRGGYFGEAVFDEAQREMLDLATPDPASVRFKVQKDDNGKEYWQLGQLQENSQFVPLDEEPGVVYIPVDPFPGNPYGRPLVAPAIFGAVFLIGLLHDLRRVISQQGWPRIDIALNTEKLLENLNQLEEVSSSEDVESVIGSALQEVREVFAKLQPDDAYIHSDEVEIKGPIGITTGANLAGIDSVISVVERMLTRALKTMPLMLGITDGVSEANANRQWEIFVAGVKSLQHLAESMLNYMFGLACQAQGVQAEVKFEFAEIRAAEAQRDALARSQEIDNGKKLYDQGLIDQDELSQDLVGHPPAEEEPRFAAALKEANEAQANDTNTDPGETKSVVTWEPVSHPMRADHMMTRAAQRDWQERQGFGVRVDFRRASRRATGLSRAFSEAGENWQLVALKRDEYGEEAVGMYDVFYDAVPQH